MYCHSGIPARRLARSQAALTTAPIAMCMTPFSGPSQRNCESPIEPTVQRRPAARVVGHGHPDDVGGERPDGGDGTSLPRPIVKTSPYPSPLPSAPPSLVRNVT